MMTEIQSAVAAIVGNCYPVMTPDSPVPPYSVYQRVSVVPEFTQADGNVMDNVLLQVDVYAETYAQANQLAESVRAKLSADPIGAIPRSMTDIFEAEIKMFRVMQDFSVWVPSGTSVTPTTPAGLTFDPLTGRFL